MRIKGGKERDVFSDSCLPCEFWYFNYVMKMVRSFELGRVLLTTLNGRVTQSEIYNSIASSHMQIDLRLSSFALSSHFA